MMKEIKEGFRLIRYAYGIKPNAICCIMFVLLGEATMLLPSPNIWFFGGYMLMITAMFPTQLVYTLSVSGLAQGTPRRKSLQTLVPTAMNLMITVLMYLVCVINFRIKLLRQPEMFGYINSTLIWLGILTFIIMIYGAVAYKYYMISSILMFAVIYFGIRYATSQIEQMANVFQDYSFIPTALIGLIIIILGGICEYAVSLLVCKAPICKMSQNVTLRKYM